jgi:hypothetical protein
MNNPEKNRMRKKVISLFNYWKNVTHPAKYNVVSLPGESFEFEAHALDKVKSDENMLLFMYEKNREIFDSWKDSVEETMDGFYINQSLPVSSAFACLPTFAWYDFCGNPTPKRMEVISDDMGNQSVFIVTFANKFRRPASLSGNLLKLGTEVFLKNKLNKMSLLFSEQYKCKTKGMPMIMMAFTNSKSLANVWDKFGAKAQPKKRESSLCWQIIALLDKGVSDRKIRTKFKLRKMQLAGYKRTRTIRGVSGLRERMKNLQKRVDSKRKI